MAVQPMVSVVVKSRTGHTLKGVEQDIKTRGNRDVLRAGLGVVGVYNTEGRLERSVRYSRLERSRRDVKDGSSGRLRSGSSCGWDWRVSRIPIQANDGDSLAIKGDSFLVMGSPLPIGALIKSYKSDVL